MEDLFTSLLPGYIISKVIGTVPYNPVGVKGERKFEISKPTCIYGLILFICHVFLTVWLYIDIYNMDEKIWSVMVLMQCIANIILILTLLWSNYYYRNNQIILLNIIAELDAELKQIGVFPKYRKIFKYSCARIVMEIALDCTCYLLIFYVDTGVFNNQLYPYFAIYTLDTFLKFSIFLQLENWLLILCERFDAIHDNLISAHEDILHFAKSDRSGLICAIGKTASTHKKLCCYIKKLNDMYSFQLLMTTAFVFAILLTHTFNVCRFIIRKNSVDYASVLNSAYWIIYHSLKFLILCSLCSRLGTKVGTFNSSLKL